MKGNLSDMLFGAVMTIALLPWAAHGGQIGKITVKSQGPGVELRWPAQWVTNGSRLNPDFELKRSLDLKLWETLSFTNASGNSKEILALIEGAENSSGFYRVNFNIDRALAKLGPIDGASVLGYSGLFDSELERIGQISTVQFAAMYPQPTNYLDKISWDPTQAKYWDRVLKSEFKLNPVELGMLTNQGMVVSERLGGYSFADVFYRIYSADLPVYISSDSVLHAWHRTFVRVLQELEETYLLDNLSSILDGINYGLTNNWAQLNLPKNSAARAVFEASFYDVDYFVTVARSLLWGTPQASQFGQNTRVAAALKAIQDEAYVENFDLFGAPRAIDFSQFMPRGHYAESVALQRYFRVMMWCGRIDFRIAGKTYGMFEEDTARQLADAILLWVSMYRSNAIQTWHESDSLLQTFVGQTDSSTPPQLANILNLAGLGPSGYNSTLTRITNSTILTNLQRTILLGQVGQQNIRGDVFYSPLTAEQIVLPRSFTLIGQRFVSDSWALSQVIFDSIQWDTNGVPELADKVQRRIPSALDIAFSVLGNNQIAGDLVERIVNPAGRRFRDGLPYQHNLAAVRSVIDMQTPASWSDNIYVNWLAALRELSASTTGLNYPESMRTRAWAMKTLNTQLASWTQLRHDTVLYAKQSYTAPLLCEYPYGFVEPVPAFWQRLSQMAIQTAGKIQSIRMSGSRYFTMPGRFGDTQTVYIDLAQLKSKLYSHFTNFAQVAAQLQGIATKELNQQPLNAVEIEFLQNVMENHTGYMSYKVYDGWYPSLYYASQLDGEVAGEGKLSDKWDALVTDVHTDAPATIVGDPGCVLHEAVGNVHLMMIAVDNGPDRMVFTGPVLSHYEFEMEGIQRKTDAEWKSDLRSGKAPPHPEWTRGYLVPGIYTVPAEVQ